MNDQRQPNFLLIVVDDMGYSDCQPFGGEIWTPNLQQLADSGVCFRHFHTSALCAPTRAMLLSGCDNHHAGLGHMPTAHATNQYMKPGYEGYLNSDVRTIPEILKESGYHTYMAGKWHLGEQEERQPYAWGFDRVFSFLGGGVSHFKDQRPLSEFEQPHTIYTEDGKTVETLPDDFYSSDYYTHKMMQYISEQQDDKPFFAYLAFTAPHDPLQVPEEELDAHLERIRAISRGDRKAKVNRATQAQQTITASADELMEIRARNRKWRLEQDQRPGARNKGAKYTSNKTHYSPVDPDARIAVKPGKARKLSYLTQLAVDTSCHVITHVQADLAGRKDN